MATVYRAKAQVVKVAVGPADGNRIARIIKKGGIIPEGVEPEKLKQLAKLGLIEKVDEAAETADAEAAATAAAEAKAAADAEAAATAAAEAKAAADAKAAAEAEAKAKAAAAAKNTPTK